MLGRLFALLLTTLAMVAGCYTPPKPDCGFVCGPGGACPEDYACATDGWCHRNGAPTTPCAIDAPPPPPDGPPIDTPAPDTTSPMVVTTSPANGDINVSVDATIIVEFSETVVGVSSASFAVLVNGTLTDGLVQSLSPTTFSFAANTPFPAGTVVDVRLTPAITDTSGNALAETIFSFTTAP